MRIEILQAGTGDSIWISHNKKNVGESRDGSLIH